jgi:hypothetical protein
MKPNGKKNKQTKALQKTADSTVATPKKTREQLIDGLSMAICKATGTQFSEVADRFVHQAACALAFPKPEDAAASLKTAILLIQELEPKNFTEAALAIQMVATGEAALMFMHRATIPEQSTETIDRNVARATRLMRLHLEQIEAMQKLKGKAGQQKVTVEHVHVHEGGQAIVGTVSTSKGEGGGGR